MTTNRKTPRQTTEPEKEIVMRVLDGLLFKHDAKRWLSRERTS